VAAVALGLEAPSDESNSLKGEPIDRAQRRWGKRLRLVRNNGRSTLVKFTAGDWQHRTQRERRAAEEEALRLESTGRPLEARARRLFLGAPSGNRKQR
jgi:hypothetical protein